MNTTELVRFVERAQPRRKAPRTPAPLFPRELFGPVRQAIVCARQLLLSTQQENGAWLGLRTLDASMASQLIFLLAYMKQEHTSLAQAAAATILSSELPSGGWSVMCGRSADLSVSVQAYFALKLSGLDPADERLARARIIIRKLGGADASNVTTRRFLALFGQVSYDCCLPAPPESFPFRSPRSPYDAPLSLIWSHRSVRQIKFERGARELFINKPADWSAAADDEHTEKASKIGRLLQSLLMSTFKALERRGFTALRLRALNHAESRLLEQATVTKLRELSFGNLVWNMIALHASGYSPDGDELRACQQRLNEIIHVRDDADPPLLEHCPTPIADGLAALLSLRVSGLPTNHPSILAGVRWLARSRRTASPMNIAELADVVRVLCSATEDAAGAGDPLPPELDVHDQDDEDQRWPRSTAANRFLGRAHPHVEEFVEQILNQRQRDGGWGDPLVTADILAAITLAECDGAPPAIERSIEYLRAAQRADGSWRSNSEADPILTTSKAICALLAARVSNDDDAVAAGLNWLAIQQCPNGAWSDALSTIHGESSKINFTECNRHLVEPANTACGLMAFVAAGQSAHRVALRAVMALVDSQSTQGGWNVQRFAAGDGESVGSHGDDVQTVALPLLALSRWLAAAASAQSAATDPFSLRLVSAPAAN